MKLYDVIKKLLEKYPELRDSDRKLLWAVWHQKGLINDFNMIDRDSFYKAPSSESITRARRKVQEEFSHLRASNYVEQERARLRELFRESKGHVDTQ